MAAKMSHSKAGVSKAAKGDFKVSFLYVLENKKDAGVIHQHQKV